MEPRPETQIPERTSDGDHTDYPTFADFAAWERILKSWESVNGEGKE